MSVEVLTQEEWASVCNEDIEFRQASRHWNGGLQLKMGQHNLALTLEEGCAQPGLPQSPGGLLTYSGSEAVWEELLAAQPKRFHNDLAANITVNAGLDREGDRLTHAQYYAAVMRAVELLRPQSDDAPLRQGDVSAAGVIDAPVGRYIHLNLAGCDHRIYFEEAGQGIPVLLQHTAGCHGSQWRHLFEMPEITQQFRLIAYDLPYHGKSVPPVEQSWWAQPYNLEGEFLRSVPLKLAEALNLDCPVFMGCSVGGLLALDLAHKHPERFRAVISVEGALQIEGSHDALGELWHPRISNEYKARLMEGLMSPNSPTPYRKETSFVYASGWPPAFLGDLFYYIEDFDLSTQAAEIDTQKTAVHILSGEYDYSGTSEHGRAAHAAIAGSTWAEMKGVGHFPMSENPVVFARHLQPILEQIAQLKD